MKLARAVIVPVRPAMSRSTALLIVLATAAPAIGLISLLDDPDPTSALQAIDVEPTRTADEELAFVRANLLVERVFRDWTATQRTCPARLADFAPVVAHADPWGTDYAVLCGYTPGGLRARIVSAGADEVFGTKDDVWSRWQ